MVVQDSPKVLVWVRFLHPVQRKSQLILAVIFGKGDCRIEFDLLKL